jgi:hypothetical protein
MSYLKYKEKRFLTDGNTPAGTMNATVLANAINRTTVPFSSYEQRCSSLPDCAAFHYNRTERNGELYSLVSDATRLPNFGDDINMDSYVKTANFTAIPGMEKEIAKDIMEVRHDPGTMSATFEESYNNSMLTGVIWAMLGTSLLVYAFKSMD